VWPCLVFLAVSGGAPPGHSVSAHSVAVFSVRGTDNCGFGQVFRRVGHKLRRGASAGREVWCNAQACAALNVRSHRHVFAFKRAQSGSAPATPGCYCSDWREALTNESSPGAGTSIPSATNHTSQEVLSHAARRRPNYWDRVVIVGAGRPPARPVGARALTRVTGEEAGPTRGTRCGQRLPGCTPLLGRPDWWKAYGAGLYWVHQVLGRPRRRVRAPWEATRRRVFF